jgi:hypothetical protein
LPAKNWEEVYPWNEVEEKDHCHFGDLRLPWSAGSFQWVIPYHYRVEGDSPGHGYLFTTVTQYFELDVDGTARISKGDVHVERSPE